MSEKRLIDADALKGALLLEGNLGYVHTLQDVERCIDAAPQVLPECTCQKWNSISDTPPLKEDSWDDGKEHYTCYVSDELILFLKSGEMRFGRLIRDSKTDYWVDNGEVSYTYEVTHWMPKPPKPMEVT